MFIEISLDVVENIFQFVYLVVCMFVVLDIYGFKVVVYFFVVQLFGVFEWIVVNSNGFCG